MIPCDIFRGAQHDGLADVSGSGDDGEKFRSWVKLVKLQLV